MTDQPPLIPGYEAPAPATSLRHADMLRIYGRCEGHVCGECAHCVRKRRGRTAMFYKCELAGTTASAASDWRAKWEACGKWALQ
jgi:hypothetical protein